jgi:hypothetical protein
MTTLVILQPSYLPWLGFFDQVRRADFFVFYDDVQFDKHGWRNRNRIKTVRGPAWLTVPVRTKGRMGQRIHEIEIDNTTPWARKHLQSIAQAYARAPHKEPYLGALAEILDWSWTNLADLDIAVSTLMCEWFGLKTPLYRASVLGIGGDRNQRLLNLCHHFGCNRYLTGNAAQDYLDIDVFQRHGVSVEWQNYHHPEYPQLHGAFEPYLSALDYMLNTGSTSVPGQPSTHSLQEAL